MIHEDKKIEMAETEVLSAEERKVALLLGNLKRVGAPKNFDFRLKARIANASAADYKPNRLLPILRYAMPLTLVVLIGTFFVLNDTYSVSDAPAVTETSAALAPIKAEDSPQTNYVKPPIEAGQPILPTVALEKKNQEFAAAGPKQKPRYFPPARIQTSQSASGGSYTRTVKGPGEIIYPRGFNPPVIAQVKPDASEGAGKFTVPEILTMIGIDADFDTKVWKIKSVTKNGMAERAGVRAGDLLEAIDGRPVGGKANYTGSLGAKFLSVRRENKTVQIQLKEK